MEANSLAGKGIDFYQQLVFSLVVKITVKYDSELQFETERKFDLKSPCNRARLDFQVQSPFQVDISTAESTTVFSVVGDIFERSFTDGSIFDVDVDDACFKPENIHLGLVASNSDNAITLWNNHFLTDTPEAPSRV